LLWKQSFEIKEEEIIEKKEERMTNFQNYLLLARKHGKKSLRRSSRVSQELFIDLWRVAARTRQLHDNPDKTLSEELKKNQMDLMQRLDQIKKDKIEAKKKRVTQLTLKQSSTEDLEMTSEKVPPIVLVHLKKKKYVWKVVKPEDQATLKLPKIEIKLVSPDSFLVEDKDDEIIEDLDDDDEELPAPKKKKTEKKPKKGSKKPPKKQESFIEKKERIRKDRNDELLLVNEALKWRKVYSATLYREREEKRIIEKSKKDKVEKTKTEKDDKDDQKDFTDKKKEKIESDALVSKFTSCWKMSLGNLINNKSFMNVIQIRMHYLQHCFSKFQEFCILNALEDLPNIWEDKSFFTLSLYLIFQKLYKYDDFDAEMKKIKKETPWREWTYLL
jgi:hypothetical protein